MPFKFNPLTGKLDIVNLPDGTAAGQIPFWGMSAGIGGWTHTEVSELFWDDANKRLGINEDTPLAGLHLGSGTLLALGATGGTPVSGVGRRLMWIPAKGAFRAGRAVGTKWDDANIGDYSVAFGSSNAAAGDYSTCFGYGGSTAGIYSFHTGYLGVAGASYSAHFGRNGVASGTVATHFGRGGTASGLYSTHFGRDGVVSGSYSTHFGYQGIAAGNYSWVGGRYMQLSAAATSSFAFGYHTSAVSLTQPNTFYIFPGGTYGKVAIGTTVPTAMMDINSDILRLRTAKTPASAGAAGNQGDECWDANYHYRCIATNTWKRVAIATW
jgi:hypothetical protein